MVGEFKGSGGISVIGVCVVSADIKSKSSKTLSLNGKTPVLLKELITVDIVAAFSNTFPNISPIYFRANYIIIPNSDIFIK